MPLINNQEGLRKALKNRPGVLQDLSDLQDIVRDTLQSPDATLAEVPEDAIVYTQRRVTKGLKGFNPSLGAVYAQNLVADAMTIALRESGREFSLDGPPNIRGHVAKKGKIR